MCVFCFLQQYPPPSSCHLFRACHSDGEITDKMNTRTFSGTEKREKQTEMWIKVGSCRVAKCIRSSRAQEYSNSCVSSTAVKNKQIQYCAAWDKPVMNCAAPLIHLLFYCSTYLMMSLLTSASRLHPEIGRFYNDFLLIPDEHELSERARGICHACKFAKWSNPRGRNTRNKRLMKLLKERNENDKILNWLSVNLS